MSKSKNNERILILNRMGYSTKRIAKMLRIPQGSISFKLKQLEEVPTNQRNIPFMDTFLDSLTMEEKAFMSRKMRVDYTARDLFKDALKELMLKEEVNNNEP